MFPIKWNDAFRKKDGTMGTMENSGGGGGGSFTPDYENEVLNIGTVDGWAYYIPMSKRYVGPGIYGYRIETDPSSSSSFAKINIYGVIYNNGEIVYENLITQLVHNSTSTYEDDNISVSYSGSSWSVTTKVTMYNSEGTEYVSPISWAYDIIVNYLLLTEDPS